MAGFTEDSTLIRYAIEFVIELYRELTDENGAPTLGTQNQAVNFILADPELGAAIAAWGQKAQLDEATTEPPQRPPYDTAYRRIGDFLPSVMDPPVFLQKM